MKILYVQDTDWIRRNPMQHNHLAERMVLRGHEIRVIDYEILWRSEGKKELFSKRQTFRVSRLLENAWHTVIRPPIVKIPILDYVSMFITYTREIRRQVREFDPDIIIGDCLLTPYLAFHAARKNNIPSVYYILDVSHRLIPFKFLQILGRMLERSNFRSADKVIALNQGLKDYCLSMGAAASKTMVLTAGADLSRVRSASEGENVRKAWGIESDDLVLFFVGWIHRFQGLKDIALQMAKRNDVKLKLLVVGDGDGYEDLYRIKKTHHLDKNIILAGQKPYDEVPAFLAAADICLLPSCPDEPIMQNVVPIKLYDYFAAGKPVISARLPGVVKEFGEDNGIVYVDRPEDTVEKALWLSRNGLINDLGTKARSFAERHSWDNIADEFERKLKEVIERRKNDRVPE